MTRTNWEFILAIVAAVNGIAFFLGSRPKPLKMTDMRSTFARMAPRLGALLIGVSLVFFGLALRDPSNVWSDVLNTFLLVTGVQVILSALGIRLELLGSNPVEIAHTDKVP